VGEYLAAGVTFVCVLDGQTQSLHLYQIDEPPQILAPDEDFALPAVLGDFRVRVGRYFE
jgi:hypothetical protein